MIAAAREPAATDRFARVDWTAVEKDLDARGCAVIPGLLDAAECTAVIAGYDDEALYRNTITMSRHGFGRGEYRYFAYPLPALVDELRTNAYPHLARIANSWATQLASPIRYPDTHAELLARCHAGGQARPTPLVLRYGEGDYNCLHQDLYGEHVFPLQLAVLLDDDFTGGDFVVTEQRPRMQSRVEVVPLGRGDAVVFAVHHRPVQGTRGVYRVTHRHGVSRIRSGRRHTLGVIFHDAA